jgi:predicted ribosomally synthesized peptide with SipW-like signal peptide
MKRKTLIVAVAVCLAAILAFGTLAFFSANDDITNTFMVAQYDPENPPTADDLFSVKVYETKDGEETEEGITYENIKPGDVLSKDPTVENTGRYDQYIRVNVTVTNAKAWQAACAKHDITNLATIFDGFENDLWTRYDAPVYNEEADTLTYTYYYNGVLAPEESVTLFKTVTIPETFDNADMASLAYFQLSVSADAIQADNTGDNAHDAFANHWGK